MEKSKDIQIQQAMLIYPGHHLHKKVLTVSITNGAIQSIEVLDGVTEADKMIAPAFFDGRAVINEPGFEYKECLDDTAKAAHKGGFSSILCTPNTEPITQTAADVRALKHATELVDVEVMAALSKDTKGGQMNEYEDLKGAGALLFGDGTHSIQDSHFLITTLLYLKKINALVVDVPYNNLIASKGQIHEGVVSTSLGLPGIPVLAEELSLQRHISLVEYTDARMHFSCVSSAKAVAMVRAAKAKGLKVTADVAVNNLYFTENNLQSFDTSFKVMPPLRTEKDRLALVEGVKDGTIDFVVSNHHAHDKEAKDLEFDWADFGALSLETVVPATYKMLKTDYSVSDMVQLFSIKNRQCLGLEVPKFELGAKAQLCMFTIADDYTFEARDVQSPARNHPYVGESFEWKSLGVVNGEFSSLEL